LTVHQLHLVMEGQLDEIINALVAHYQAEKLRAESVAA
jgi:peptide chain release factor 1